MWPNSMSNLLTLMLLSGTTQKALYFRSLPPHNKIHFAENDGSCKHTRAQLLQWRTYEAKGLPQHLKKFWSNLATHHSLYLAKNPILNTRGTVKLPEKYTRMFPSWLANKCYIPPYYEYMVPLTQCSMAVK